MARTWAHQRPAMVYSCKSDEGEDVRRQLIVANRDGSSSNNIHGMTPVVSLADGNGIKMTQIGNTAYGCGHSKTGRNPVPTFGELYRPIKRLGFLTSP